MELREDVPDVLLARSLGEPELTGDAGVRAALGHQGQHLAFPYCEDGERVRAPSDLDQCLHETRVDDRSARSDPPQRLDELVHVQDAALEQVADPIAGGEQFRRLLDLDVCRQDEDAGLRKLVADRVGGLEPLGRVRGRHPNVDDHELWLMFAHELDQLVCVARLAGDLEVGSLEQAREPFAQKDVVVGHDDATAGGRLRIHDRLNLTPMPGSWYGNMPALRMQRGALVGYRREAG